MKPQSLPNVREFTIVACLDMPSIVSHSFHMWVVLDTLQCAHHKFEPAALYLAGGQNVRCNREICKVRKTQHQQQNPEFGHKLGEIPKKTCKIIH